MGVVEAWDSSTDLGMVNQWRKKMIKNNRSKRNWKLNILSWYDRQSYSIPIWLSIQNFNGVSSNVNIACLIRRHVPIWICQPNALPVRLQWLGNMEQPLHQRQGTESEYLPTELDGVSGVDVKTKKDKVVDLSVWSRSEVELKYFVYVAEMKDNKLCFNHHHIWYRSLIVLWNIAIIFYLLNFLCIPCNFNAGDIYSVRKVMTISYWSDRWKVMSPIIWNNIKQVPINKNLMK